MAVNPSSVDCELDLLVKLSRDGNENDVECATGKLRGEVSRGTCRISTGKGRADFNAMAVTSDEANTYKYLYPSLSLSLSLSLTLTLFLYKISFHRNRKSRAQKKLYRTDRCMCISF